MTEQFTLSFEGSGESIARRCKLHNGTKFPVRNVGISARTAKFPVTWDAFEGMEGSATLSSIEGLDTEVIFFRFANFNAGETVKFDAIEADFTGDPNSTVYVDALVGSRVHVLFEVDWTQGFGELQMNNGRLEAIITKQ